MYSFVTGGIESALEQAKAAAVDKNVSVMGGADIGQQYIAAGLVGEIQIHPVPVLFGSDRCGDPSAVQSRQVTIDHREGIRS